MKRSTISVIAAVVILLGSLAVSTQFEWVASNSQGPITYTVRGAGLPLQFIQSEVGSPVGASSYFKVDAAYLAVDFLVWALVAFLVLHLLKIPKPAVHAPPSPP